MNQVKAFGVFGLMAALLAAPTHAARPATEASARLLDKIEPRIKAIYETDGFHMRSFHATWLPDGTGYIKLETPDGAAGSEIARYDSASGECTVMAAPAGVPTANGSPTLAEWRLQVIRRERLMAILRGEPVDRRHAAGLGATTGVEDDGESGSPLHRGRRVQRQEPGRLEAPVGGAEEKVIETSNRKGKTV